MPGTASEGESELPRSLFYVAVGLHQECVVAERAKAGAWVRIHNVILPAEERAPRGPDDTARVPFEMWLQGFLVDAEAEVRQVVTIATATGREVEGRLVAVNPVFSRNYEEPVPELLSIGPELRELLAQLEGMERGPAGNTSLAAAFCLAQEMDEDQVLVVQETEYTGAGKHPSPQLTFARQNGIEIKRCHRSENRPGVVIAIPQHPGQMSAKEMDLDAIRRSYVKHALHRAGDYELDDTDRVFLCEDSRSSINLVSEVVEAMRTGLGGH